jgi:hypothetical protein
MKLSNAEIQKGISELPDNIKKAVIGFDWAGEIMTIGNEHRMHMDEIDLFRQQTLAVILGKFPAANYESHLVDDVGLSEDIAQAIVAEANDRIFLELQRRAFSRDTEEAPETTSKIIGVDPYQEPISHHEMKNDYDKEGIELINEGSVSSLDTDLHKEVAMIMAGNEPPLGPREETSEEETTPSEESKAKSPDYNESISENDLKGIDGHRTNTNILKQQSPENIFNSSGRDFGQGEYSSNQSMDKKTLSEKIIRTVEKSQVDEIEQTSSNDFLKKLSGQKEPS